jgi:hypothetical protein
MQLNQFRDYNLYLYSRNRNTTLTQIAKRSRRAETTHEPQPHYHPGLTGCPNSVT